MRRRWHSQAGCACCWLVGLAMCLPAAAWAEEGSSALGGTGGAPLESPLVAPGVQPLVGGQGVSEAEAALQSSPETALNRELSESAYEGLDAEQAASLAGEVFPGVIDEPAGGPPKLVEGESVAGYPTDNDMQVDLGEGGEGKHAVIESLVPLAVETSPGRREPVDLGLSDVEGAFEPKTPVVGVRIPKKLQDGVSLGSTGVSLTPVDASGTPVGGSEGRVDGAVVFYGAVGAGSDVNAAVKPTTLGFDSETFLRSVRSPEVLLFRVGMPEGVSLVQAKDGSGAVQIVNEGTAIASVSAPDAQDAVGAPVPVSMSVTGDLLRLTVDVHSGEYRWPIEVDPQVIDEQLTGSSKPTHWKFAEAEHSTQFTSSGWKETHGLVLESTGTYHGGEEGFLNYQAIGEARIIRATVQASGYNHGKIETKLQLTNGTNPTDTKLIAPAESPFTGEYTVCPFPGKPEEECPGGFTRQKEVAQANIVHFAEAATGEGSGENKATVNTADVTVWQEHGPTVMFNTTSEKVDGRTNVLYKEGAWLSKYNGAFEIEGEDPGVGLSEMGVVAGSWASVHGYLEEGLCEGIWCHPSVKEMFTYPEKGPPADGEDFMELAGEDGMKEFAPGAKATLKVDSTPPYGLNLLGLPAGGQINDEIYHLKVQATDGKGTIHSSGVKSLVLGLDGYVLLGGKAGSCTPGPCTVTGEWTLNGENFGAGKHKLELVATDYAGNEEKAEYSITVRHAGPLSVGPGSVDPITGALRLGASDVSIGGGQGSLGVSRSYNSRELTAGAQGPLGPQWSFSVSGSQGVEQEPTGSVVLISSEGGRTSFESDGKGGFISPKGDENLVLEAEKEGETIKAYLLKNPAEGTTVKYVQQGGAGLWVIASTEGALSKTNGEKETFEWERLEGVTRPKRAIATPPQGVTCPPAELKPGCRALEFEYATTTTAEGEAPNQWKDYKNRLKKVSFRAYNPAAKEMETKSVAEYAYDTQGRLRAEWDPRISLKTTYGYDAENHVVAVSPPGQEPSLFHYGTTGNDSSPGRLLSVTRPAAVSPEKLKEQHEMAAPVNTPGSGEPLLSNTSPVIGTTLSVSSGSWSNTPLAYSYEWEDCSPSGKECAPIPGAVNQSYTPQGRDGGYTLKAQVTAVNADGAAVASTEASKALSIPAPTYNNKFGTSGSGAGQFNGPASVAIKGSVIWVTDPGNSRVVELEDHLSSISFVKAIGWGVSNGKAELETCTSSCQAGTAGSGSGQFSKPEGIAVNPATGNFYVVDKGNNRIEEFNSNGEYTRVFGEKGSEPGQLSSPESVAIAPENGNVWVSDTSNNRVDEFSETGGYLGSFGAGGSGNGQFASPSGIAFSGGNAYVVDSGNNRVQEFSMSGEWIRVFGSKGAGEGQLARIFR